MTILVKALGSSSKLFLQSCCHSKNVVHRMKFPISVSFISTSKKSKDIVTLQDSLPTNTNKEIKPKDFVSWGFDTNCEIEDNSYMHLCYFVIISVCFCFGGFILTYQPDNRMIDWVRREAFLELRRREELGLPLMEKDLIPVDQMELPTDEELEDIEIII